MIRPKNSCQSIIFNRRVKSTLATIRLFTRLLFRWAVWHASMGPRSDNRRLCSMKRTLGVEGASVIVSAPAVKVIVQFGSVAPLTVIGSLPGRLETVAVVVRMGGIVRREKALPQCLPLRCFFASGSGGATFLVLARRLGEGASSRVTSAPARSSRSLRNCTSLLNWASRRSYVALFLVHTSVCGEPLRSVTCVRSMQRLSICWCKCWRSSLRRGNRCTCSTGSRRNRASSLQSAHLQSTAPARVQSAGGSIGVAVKDCSSVMQ